VATPGIRIVGLTELTRALRLLAPTIAVEMRAGLKGVVEMVAQEARNEAALQDFTPPGLSGRGSGALIGSIRGGVTMRKGYIVESAARDDYPYPKIYEYARNRAFMRPAVNKNTEKIVASLDVVLDQALLMFSLL
jgi:hypothetical protein